MNAQDLRPDLVAHIDVSIPAYSVSQAARLCRDLRLNAIASGLERAVAKTNPQHSEVDIEAWSNLVGVAGKALSDLGAIIPEMSRADADVSSGRLKTFWCSVLEIKHRALLYAKLQPAEWEQPDPINWNDDRQRRLIQDAWVRVSELLAEPPAAIEPKKCHKKRGPKKATPEEKKQDIEIFKKWEAYRAKQADVGGNRKPTIAGFARQEGLRVVDVKAILDRVRKRKRDMTVTTL